MFQNSSPHQSLRANFAAQRIKDILDQDDRIHASICTASQIGDPMSPYFNGSLNGRDGRCSSMMETPRVSQNCGRNPQELRFDLDVKPAQNSTVHFTADGKPKR